MPRKPRRELVDGLCHITARGNGRQRIFRGDDDVMDLLLPLDEAIRRYGGVVCHAFCVMPNHVHLVLDAPQPQLSSSLRYAFGVFAQRFHRRYGTNGHVFQGRFYSEPILREPHFIEVVRYVLRNPVRARLCDSPADWEWSSFHAYLDESARPPFLTADVVLDLFSPRPTVARRELAAYVERGDSPGTVPYPKPYTPAKRSASRRTRSAAGSPTTLR
jgi:REP element-mobilizing transposase RayT